MERQWKHPWIEGGDEPKVDPEVVKVIEKIALNDFSDGSIRVPDHSIYVHVYIEDKFDIKHTYFLGYAEGYHRMRGHNLNDRAREVEGVCLSYIKMKEMVANSSKKDEWFFINEDGKINHGELKRISSSKKLYGRLILQLQRYSVIENVSFYPSLTERVIRDEVIRRGVGGYVEMFNTPKSRDEFLLKIYQKFLSVLSDHKLELLNTAHEIVSLTKRYLESPLSIAERIIAESYSYARYPSSCSYSKFSYRFKEKFFEILENYPDFKKDLLLRRLRGLGLFQNKTSDAYINPYDQPYLIEKPNVVIAESSKRPSLDQIEGADWWYKG